MRWSIRIARIAGTDLKIHLTFLLLLAWIGISYYNLGGMPAVVEGLTFVLLLFGCVVLHEFGHVAAGRAFGIKTPDITLLPIGGVARMQRMPDKPWQELVVAVAGPAVNVVIAGVLIALLRGRVDWTHLENIGDPRVAMATKLAAVNVMLVVFNMIPAFPMDGGRVLRSLLAMWIGHTRATQAAAGIGQALAFVLGFIGLFYNPLLIIIALFVFMGASQEAAMAKMKEVTAGLRVGDAMVTEFVVLNVGDTLEVAANLLLRTSQHEFPVVNGEGRPLGILTRNGMIGGLREGGVGARALEYAERDLPALSPDDNFEGAFRVMQDCGCPALPVLDREGRLIGLVTPENVGEMMMIRSVLPKGSAPAWRRRGEAEVV